MFNKKKPNLETIQNLKNYFINKYEIPESTILSIAELNLSLIHISEPTRPY